MTKNNAIAELHRLKASTLTHDQMTDPAKNIEAGTTYLDIVYKRGGNAGVDSQFGTGKGYTTSIYECEKCLIAERAKLEKCNDTPCFQKIHK